MSVAKRYPGRDRVIARDSARDALYRQSLDVWNSPRPTDCLNPHEIHAIGLPDPHVQRGQGPLPVMLQARCRKCGPCLDHRRRLWTARAIDELRASTRTWFGTLTVAPEHRFRLRLLADRKCQSRRAEGLSELTAAEQFAAVAAECLSEAQRWLKRVRKQARVPLRYLLVVEAHKSGDPHLHILLHEPGGPVRKQVLEDQWRTGFSHWRLVEGDGPAVYACKYLTKSILTRVRASRRYGQPAAIAQVLTERLKAATRAVESEASEWSGNPACQKRAQRVSGANEGKQAHEHLSLIGAPTKTGKLQQPVVEGASDLNVTLLE